VNANSDTDRDKGQRARGKSDVYPLSLIPYPYHARSRGVVLACITTATFTDLVAYSVSVPVLPDYATRFQAGPTMIGLLFASFGVTLLTLSIPMGAVSDRVGRKGPMIVGLLFLAISTVAFAYAQSLAMLFVARLVQGAADGMTWIVGFAMIADLYGPDERGRVMGLAMAGSTLGIIIGPLIGGWLYEIGGIRLPFLFVSALAVLDLIVFALVAPRTKGTGAATPMREVLTHRPIAICALVVIAGASTISMLEPVIPLVLKMRFDLGPAAIGTLFGIAAVASTAMHPIYGRLSDRWGGRRLMLIGLVASALALPLLNVATGFQSAALVMVPMWMVFSMIITPSLAYVAELASTAGFESYGVVYGVYNVAWAVGLMAGPAIGGFLLERIGFGPLTIGWSVMLLVAGLGLARIR
jgi:MFS transporter, DHA1 family, solute carrier family 18 (vesicular amine transporter), member 1/2